MTSTPRLSIELDFFMQGVSERVNEKEKHCLLEYTERERGRHTNTN